MLVTIGWLTSPKSVCNVAVVGPAIVAELCKCGINVESSPWKCGWSFFFWKNEKYIADFRRKKADDFWLMEGIRVRVGPLYTNAVLPLAISEILQNRSFHCDMYTNMYKNKLMMFATRCYFRWQNPSQSMGLLGRHKHQFFRHSQLSQDIFFAWPTIELLTGKEFLSSLYHSSARSSLRPRPVCIPLNGTV